MKINNDFYTNKRVAFNSTNSFEKFPFTVATQSSSQNSAPEKDALKKPLKVDKFDKYSEVSQNEIIALALSLAAAAVVIVFGFAEIFKRPLS